MKKSFLLLIVGLVVMATSTLYLAGCHSGGGGGGFFGTGAGGGSSTFSSGVITGTGSIFVNGTEFGINSADILVNNGAGSNTQLKRGQLVRLRGRHAPARRTM